MTRTKTLVLCAVAIGFWIVVGLNSALPEFEIDATLWSALSGVCLLVLLITGVIHHTQRRTAERGEPVRQTDDDFRDVPQPPMSFEWFHRATRFALTAIVVIGIPLALLYFLVRFVKWAWTD